MTCTYNLENENLQVYDLRKKERREVIPLASGLLRTTVDGCIWHEMVMVKFGHQPCFFKSIMKCSSLLVSDRKIQIYFLGCGSVVYLSLSLESLKWIALLQELNTSPQSQLMLPSGKGRKMVPIIAQTTILKKNCQSLPQVLSHASVILKNFIHSNEALDVRANHEVEGIIHIQGISTAPCFPCPHTRFKVFKM